MYTHIAICLVLPFLALLLLFLFFSFTLFTSSFSFSFYSSSSFSSFFCSFCTIFLSFTSSSFSSFEPRLVSSSFFFNVVVQPHHSGSSLPFIHPHFSIPTLIFFSSSFQSYSSSFLLSFSFLLFLMQHLSVILLMLVSQDNIFFFKFVGVTFPHSESFVCLREE